MIATSRPSRNRSNDGIVEEDRTHVSDQPAESIVNGTKRTASTGCVALILRRFPHIQAVSLTLLQRHEAFRDLCEEYEDCTQACERLEQPHADETLRREYMALRLRLEGELLRYVEEHSGDDHT